MPATDLEITVLRRGRREDEFDLNADPADISGLQAVLKGWLEGNSWAPGLWPQFSADVRIAGRNKVLTRVRV